MPMTEDVPGECCHPPSRPGHRGWLHWVTGDVPGKTAALPTCMKCPEQANPSRQKVEQRLPWGRGKKARETCLIDTEFSLGLTENFVEGDIFNAIKLYAYERLK